MAFFGLSFQLPNCCLAPSRAELEAVEICREESTYATLLTSPANGALQYASFVKEKPCNEDVCSEPTSCGTGSVEESDGSVELSEKIVAPLADATQLCPHAQNPSMERPDQITRQQECAATRLAKQSVLGQSVELMQHAVVFNSDGNVILADREMLIQSFEAFATVLDRLGKIGSHITGNTKKLRSSKGTLPSKTNFKEWLLSELPMHASTKYKDYADPSAAVASIWIGWTLEFFVEMFANLRDGHETIPSINDAYKISLYSHHNFIVRNAFTMGVKHQMPNRKKLYELLRGEADLEDVVREVDQFVEFGRPIVRYLLELDDTFKKAFEAERQLLLNSK